MPDPTDESVAAYRAMPYGDFLRTTYWLTIRDHLVGIIGKCQACSSREALKVHHNSYDNHGREHAHLEDLTVLCERCHSYFHSCERLNNHIPPLYEKASLENFTIPGVENPTAQKGNGPLHFWRSSNMFTIFPLTPVPLSYFSVSPAPAKPI